MAGLVNRNCQRHKHNPAMFGGQSQECALEQRNRTPLSTVDLYARSVLCMSLDINHERFPAERWAER